MHHLFVETIEGGGMIGRSLWLRPGDVCRFGSDPSNELVLPDPSIKPKAGTLVVVSGSEASLFGAADVLIQGRIAGPSETLRSGDTFSCGPFRVLVCGYPSKVSQCHGSPVGTLIAWMRRIRGNLYAIFDAARDTRVLDLLREARCQYLSLFDGESRERMADVAPYLVSIPRDADALELLVRASWGQGWASFLGSDMDFNSVRGRLRRTLMVKLPEGEVAYFRYFDPAVLQSFLPATNTQEREEFAKGITEFVVEHSEGPHLATRFYLPSDVEEQIRIEIHPLCEIGESSGPAYEGGRIGN